MSIKNDPSYMDDYIFPPELLGTSTEQLIEEYQRTPGKGLCTYTPIDKHLKPIIGAQFGSILAFTSNGKTTISSNIAFENAKRVSDPEKDIILGFVWEQAVQEMVIADLTRYSSFVTIDDLLYKQLSSRQLTEFRKAIDERKKLPWWLVGHSLLEHKRRPRMSALDVQHACELVVDRYKMNIKLIVIDYIQRTRLLRRETREGYMEAVDTYKDLTFMFGCPVIANSQAKREVNHKEFALPDVDDGQETSNLEQSSNWMVGAWMPRKNYPLDTRENPSVLVYENHGWRVTENLVVYRVLKQVLGAAPVTGAMHLDFKDFKLYAVDSLEPDKVQEIIEAKKGKKYKKVT